MTSPYANRESRSFWRPGVADQEPGYIADLYRPRFPVDPRTKFATAGSCFAQRISRRLVREGYRVLDVEPAPQGLPAEAARQRGYATYSARYGNIYTARHLVQLAREALGLWRPADAVWMRDGRYYDALRPGVEPDGLTTRREVRLERKRHVRRVLALLKRTDVFVFTLGLTEAWTHSESGTVYPTAPETIAGTYDPSVHHMVNFTAAEVFEDLAQFRSLAHTVNPHLRLLITVSPVPIVATATPSHVLAASVYTKSTLRAAAGQLFDAFEDVDYFPSYELAATPFLRTEMFEPNLRALTDNGLETVMRHFFTAHRHQPSRPAPGQTGSDDEEDVCEEVLLDAFEG